MDTFLLVFLMKDPVGHMSNGTSDLTWKGYAPGFFKFGPCFRIRHILISGIGIRQSSHIAGALNVILSADRADTHCRASEIACHKSQVRQTLHYVYRLGKLTDAHAVKNHGGLGGGVHSRSLTDRFRRNVSDRLRIFRSIFLDHFQEFLKAFCVFLNKFRIRQTFLPDHIRHSVYQGKVGTALELEMNV